MSIFLLFGMLRAEHGVIGAPTALDEAGTGWTQAGHIATLLRTEVDTLLSWRTSNEYTFNF